jgi:exodeoxyribonuclease VII large subunit
MTASGYSLRKSVDGILKNESREVLALTRQTGRQSMLLLQKHKIDLPVLQKNLGSKIAQNIQYQKQSLAVFENSVHNLDPVNVLKRGFSITRKNGIAISSTQGVNSGDEIETLVVDGKISSIIKSKTNTQ